MHIKSESTAPTHDIKDESTIIQKQSCIIDCEMSSKPNLIAFNGFCDIYVIIFAYKPLYSSFSLSKDF